MSHSLSPSASIVLAFLIIFLSPSVLASSGNFRPSMLPSPEAQVNGGGNNLVIGGAVVKVAVPTSLAVLIIFIVYKLGRCFTNDNSTSSVSNSSDGQIEINMVNLSCS